VKSRKFVSKDEIDEVALIRIVYRLSMTKGQGRDLREYSRVRVQMKPIRPLGVDISRKNRLRLSMTNLVTRVKAKRGGSQAKRAPTRFYMFGCSSTIGWDL